MSELLFPDRNGPALWQAILEIVGLHWRPVVAGGCVRDYVLVRNCKDIDVFVPASCREDFDSIIEQLDPKTCHGKIISHGPEGDCANEYRLGEETECFGVWEGEIIGLPVNIVGRKSLEEGTDELVATLDFGINQCAWGPWRWTTTSYFWQDKHANTFTLAHNRTYEQSLARFDRINARHGGLYRLVDPFITEL